MPDHPDATRYQRIFEQAPEAHLVLSRSDGIVAANHAACDLLGYTEAELTAGVHVTDLDLQATQADVEQAHSDPERRLPAHFESRYRRRWNSCCRPPAGRRPDGHNDHLTPVLRATLSGAPFSECFPWFLPALSQSG